MSGSKLGRPRSKDRTAEKWVRSSICWEPDELEYIAGLASESGISVSQAIRNLVRGLREPNSIPEPHTGSTIKGL